MYSCFGLFGGFHRKVTWLVFFVLFGTWKWGGGKTVILSYKERFTFCSKILKNWCSRAVWVLVAWTLFPFSDTEVLSTHIQHLRNLIKTIIISMDRWNRSTLGCWMAKECLMSWRESVVTHCNTTYTAKRKHYSAVEKGEARKSSSCTIWNDSFKNEKKDFTATI